MTEKLLAIAARFAIPGGGTSVEPYGAGHINASYLVTPTSGPRYLLQRINPRVFPCPAQVMENIERVTAHLKTVLARERIADPERRALRLVPTHKGPLFLNDDQGHCWRMYHYIEGTRSLERPPTADAARQAARGIGLFQRWLADYRGPRLHETIPDFHHTPLRVETLARAIEVDRLNRSTTARPEIDIALTHRPLAGVLIERQASGEIAEHIVHNDAKLSNVLLDADSGEALSVVDLDTVMPGLALYDFGDLARSMAGGAAEDEQDLSKLTVRPEFFEALARGYLETAGEVLVPLERGLLVTAARLITYEQGVRFLTDYLEGDRYYRTARPQHNLERCRAQFALLASFTGMEDRLERIVERI